MRYWVGSALAIYRSQAVLNVALFVLWGGERTLSCCLDLAGPLNDPTHISVQQSPRICYQSQLASGRLSFRAVHVRGG